MVDITHKIETLREATAQAIVSVSSPETIQAIKDDAVPKGDIFEMAKAAALLGVKKTPDLLPDCHPLPIEHARVAFELQDEQIFIHMTLKTIYKTGVEVEAMHGASVAALTIYDMLKPIDKGVEIRTTKLLEKSGGSSTYGAPATDTLRAEVVVCSDSVAAGEKEDRSGRRIIEKLGDLGIEGERRIIPDEADDIRAAVEQSKADLLIFTGGTGVSARDITPDTVRPLLDTTLQGVEEQMRRYGQQRTPYAMLSRSVAGIQGSRLVLGLPGSSAGVAECLDAVFPHLLHVFNVLKGTSHE